LSTVANASEGEQGIDSRGALPLCLTWNHDSPVEANSIASGHLCYSPLPLESTVISHGLPYPHNLRLALRLEEIAAAHAARPAMLGIIAGEIIVGLSRKQIEHLAVAPNVRTSAAATRRRRAEAGQRSRATMV